MRRFACYRCLLSCRRSVTREMKPLDCELCTAAAVTLRPRLVTRTVHVLACAHSVLLVRLIMCGFCSYVVVLRVVLKKQARFVCFVKRLWHWSVDVAQMVERSLSMREVQGSIPSCYCDKISRQKHFPNVHFVVHLRHPLTLSNIFLPKIVFVVDSETFCVLSVPSVMPSLRDKRNEATRLWVMYGSCCDS